MSYKIKFSPDIIKAKFIPCDYFKKINFYRKKSRCIYCNKVLEKISKKRYYCRKCKVYWVDIIVK